MKKPDQLRCAVGQLCSTDSIEKNLEQILGLCDSVKDSSDCILFPENSLYFRINPKDKVQGLDPKHNSFMQLQKWVDQYKKPILLGSLPYRTSKAKMTNAMIFIAPQKKHKVVYQKMHLFDVDVVEKNPIRESDVFMRGEEPAVIDICGWKWGLSICYDIRFAELYSFYRHQEVDAIVVPSAFLRKTGQAHWHTLLRARAIETQSYVVAPAQAGGHHSTINEMQRDTFGHSLVVDPWGEVLLDMDQVSPRAAVVTLQRSRLDFVRGQIPMHAHRHPWFKQAKLKKQ